MKGRLLTFAQVREAGVFAWRPDHYVYVDGRLLRDIGAHGADGSIDPPLHFVPSVMTGDEPFLNGNWRHLDDCSCFLCSYHEAMQTRLLVAV